MALQSQLLPNFNALCVFLLVCAANATQAQSSFSHRTCVYKFECCPHLLLQKPRPKCFLKYAELSVDQLSGSPWPFVRNCSSDVHALRDFPALKPGEEGWHFVNMTSCFAEGALHGKVSKASDKTAYLLAWVCWYGQSSAREDAVMAQCLSWITLPDSSSQPCYLRKRVLAIPCQNASMFTNRTIVLTPTALALPTAGDPDVPVPSYLSASVSTLNIITSAARTTSISKQSSTNELLYIIPISAITVLLMCMIAVLYWKKPCSKNKDNQNIIQGLIKLRNRSDKTGTSLPPEWREVRLVDIRNPLIPDLANTSLPFPNSWRQIFRELPAMECDDQASRWSGHDPAYPSPEPEINNIKTTIQRQNSQREDSECLQQALNSWLDHNGGCAKVGHLFDVLSSENVKLSAAAQNFFHGYFRRHPPRAPATIASFTVSL